MRGHNNSHSLPQLSVISASGEEVELTQPVISPLTPQLAPTFRAQNQNLSPFWLSSAVELPQLPGYTSSSPGPGQASSQAAMSMLHAAAITGDVEGLDKLASGKFCDIDLRDKFGRTPLMYGVLGNYPECVEILLREGAQSGLRDSSGRTALHWAAHHGYAGAAKILIRSEQNSGAWEQGDQAGVTVLHLAMRHDKTVLQLLVKKFNMKEKINILDINKRSPLHWACALGNYDQAKIISKLGADISLTDVEGKTGLHWAATARCAEPRKLVKLLVNMKSSGRASSVASWQDYEGRQALQLAVLSDNPEMVRALLGESSGLLDSVDHRSRTALHWAALRANHCVLPLLEAGAAVELRDETGASPAHLAVSSGQLSCAQLFLRSGHHDLLDSQGRTPLMWAVASGRQDMVELFTEADLGTEDKVGWSALHIAVSNNLPASLAGLLGLGADISLTNQQGETALMVAARLGSQECAELLLQAGAEVNSLDPAGRSALTMASYGGHHELVVVLLDRGARVDQQDREGMCPLHWAVRQAHLETVRTLLDRGAFTNNIARLRPSKEAELVQLTPLDSAIMLELTEMIGLLQKYKVSLQSSPVQSRVDGSVFVGCDHR